MYRDADVVEVMTLDFDMEAVPLSQIKDDGLESNECYPKQLIDDPTFAILNGDNYFIRNGRAFEPRFGGTIPAALTQGLTAPFKRRSFVYPSESEFAVDTGNATRRLTPYELDLLAQELELEEDSRMRNEKMQVAYIDCTGGSCATEVQPMRKPTEMLLSRATVPSMVVATATAITVSLIEISGEPVAALSRGRVLLPNAAAVTAVVS
jgi:hypothetical protein